MDLKIFFFVKHFLRYKQKSLHSFAAFTAGGKSVKTFLKYIFS